MESQRLGTISAFAFRLFLKSANSFCAVAGTTIHLIALLIFSISSASAAVTYQYAGNNYELVGTQPGILSAYDASMSVQISFEVDSRLISVSGDISHLVTSYVFFDGLHIFTEVNSVLGVFYVRTDSLGNITEWSIEASTIGLEDPTAEVGDRLYYIATQADRYMTRDTATMEECWDLMANGLCLWWVNDAASVLSNPGSWSKPSSSVELPPAPDIKINGVDDPPILWDADTIQLSLHLDNNGRTELADWWLVADSPYGYLCWTPTTGWIYDQRPAYQGPLEYLDDFSSLELPVEKFARGRYRIYFGIDLVMDGVFTRPAAHWDSVDFTILR